MDRKLLRILFCAMTPIWFMAAFGENAMAQQGALEVHNQPNYVSGGIALVPDYMGSDDYTVAAGPAARFSFAGNREIKLIATTLSSNLLDHEYLRLGPVINYRFARDSVDDEVVDLMRDIDGAFELGVTAGVDFMNDTNPRYRFGAFVEVLQDVTGEHEGLLVTGSLQYWRPLGLAWDFGIRAAVTYASDDYMDTYFGVSADDSARSGLPQFSAGGGIRDVTVIPALILHFSRTWHVGGFVRYQRLLSDAADSPVVDLRGDPNQFIVGLGVVYSW